MICIDSRLILQHLQPKSPDMYVCMYVCHAPIMYVHAPTPLNSGRGEMDAAHSSLAGAASVLFVLTKFAFSCFSSK